MVCSPRVRAAALLTPVALTLASFLTSYQAERLHLPPPREAPPPIRTVPITTRFAVPVLMYHRVAELSEAEAASELMRDLTVPPADFAAQLDYLHRNGFTVLLARDVERAMKAGTPLPEKAVAITMDDGYDDNFTQAFPALRRYQMPATIFLVTATVDSARHLTWDQVRLMHQAAMGFGSHTVHHYELPQLALSALDHELRESKRVIETQLVDRVSSVAYPNGSHDLTVVERARLAGYDAGWTKGGGPAMPGDDMYELPRVRVHGRTTMDDFARKVWSGVYAIQEQRGEPIQLARGR